MKFSGKMWPMIISEVTKKQGFHLLFRKTTAESNRPPNHFRWNRNLRKIFLKWSFHILNTILYFLMLMSICHFHLSNWVGVGPVRPISVSFYYTGLLVWGFLQPHKLNITYCLKSFLLLAFCSLLGLYGWSNSNVPLIYLNIRTVSGDHM